MLDLSDVGMDEEIFQCLGRAVESGGSLLVSYEGKDSVHRDTREALSRGIPPILTRLGRLLECAGFLWIKDWRFCRGGHAGYGKLWGEKLPSAAESGIWNERLGALLVDFLLRTDRRGQHPLEEEARREARACLTSLEVKNRTLKGEMDRLLRK